MKVVPFTRDVDRDFLAVAQSHTRNFSQGRVWLLRRHRTHLQTNALFLWAFFEHRRLTLAFLQPASLTDKLIDCWHGMWFLGFADFPLSSKCGRATGIEGRKPGLRLRGKNTGRQRLLPCKKDVSFRFSRLFLLPNGKVSPPGFSCQELPAREVHRCTKSPLFALPVPPKSPAFRRLFHGGPTQGAIPSPEPGTNRRNRRRRQWASAVFLP